MERYEIRIAGHIDDRRARALGCGLVGAAAGESVLIYDAVDRSALYGLMTRLRDAGLGLLALERVADVTHLEESNDDTR